MTRVLVHNDQTALPLEILRAAHPGVTFDPCETYDGLPGALDVYQPEIVYSIRFAGTPAFPREALLNCPSVKWIAVGGSGTDHLTPWDPARMTVTNGAGVAADMMAEYAIGAMLHFTLNLDRFDADRRARRWTAGQVTPLAGRRILIVGMGATGQATARRAKALGLHVTGVRASGKSAPDCDEIITPNALQAHLGSADILMLSVPLTDATRGLIGAEALATLPQGAILIDVSRGGIVAAPALIEALSSGHLRGAALDVFETEPLPATSPLWSFDNVILTPHCSSVYPGWPRASVEMFSENLSRYVAGQPLEKIVTP